MATFTTVEKIIFIPLNNTEVAGLGKIFDYNYGK